MSQLGDFEFAFIARIQDRWDISDRDALDCLYAELEVSGIPYGSRRYEWTAAAGREWADEYMSTYGEAG